MRACAIWLSACLLVVAAGCATSADASRSWAARQGGVLADARQQRAQRVADRLIAGQEQLRITVHVLANDGVCAFAWPQRSVYVTRGLVDRADDDMLAAAMAHEMGHLLSDGHLRSIASLKGCNVDGDAERRADAYGVQLLRLRGINPQAMPRMLRLVRDGNQLPPGCRQAMTHRIELLTPDPS